MWNPESVSWITDAPHPEPIRLQRRVKRHRKITGVHAMRQGAIAAISGGRPQNRGKILIIRKTLRVKHSAHQRFEPVDNRILQRTSCPACALVEVEQNGPVGFGWNMPPRRADGV